MCCRGDCRRFDHGFRTEFLHGENFFIIISRDEHGIFTWENYFPPVLFNYIFKNPGKVEGYIIDF